MDFKFKAKPWVENICLKFENICQEVEGMVCKEAKHVEDQVQTVGANVKKFCTEVVQDFLPPSLDPTKETDSNGCVEENTIKENLSDEKTELISSEGNNSPSKPTFDEICNASNLLPPSSVNPRKEAGVDSLLDGNSFLKDDGYEEDVFEDNKEDKTPAPRFSEVISPIESHTSLLSSPSSKNHLDPLSSGDPAKESDSEKSFLSPEEHEDCGTCQKSGEGVEEIPTCEELQFPDVADVVCLGKNDCEALLSNSLGNDNFEDVGEKVSKISLSASVEVVGFTSSQESETSFANVTDSAECVANISSCLPSPERTDLVLSGLYCENKVDNTGLPLSCSILSTKSYGSEAPMTPNVLSLTGSFSDCSEKYSELVESEAFVSTTQVGDAFTRSDNGDAKLAEHNVGSNPVMNMNEFDDVKLGDSCLVVDAKELLLVSSRVRNHRSYTKKIRDAFASRTRSRKQREYKQLAIWYGDIDSEISTVRTEGSVPSMLTRQKVSKNISVHDSYESDWELL